MTVIAPRAAGGLAGGSEPSDALRFDRGRRRAGASRAGKTEWLMPALDARSRWRYRISIFFGIACAALGTVTVSNPCT